MRKARTARDLETEAAAARPPRPQGTLLPCGEAMAMLARLGLTSEQVASRFAVPGGSRRGKSRTSHGTAGPLCFPPLSTRAIQKGQGFAPEEATQYLKRAQSRECAESLVRLDLVERISRGHYRLLFAAKSFGGTLEWYVAGVKFHGRGVGGDLDVVAAAEGKLAYLELKSSPPKNLEVREVIAFFERVYMLRPDVTLFVVDTATATCERPCAALRWNKRPSSRLLRCL